MKLVISVLLWMVLGVVTVAVFILFEHLVSWAVRRDLYDERFVEDWEKETEEKINEEVKR